MKNGLLLHNCCAPCSVSAVRNLKAEFDLQGFWFNPNIHPAEENIKRRDSVAALAAKNNFALNFGPEYSEARWTETACMPGTDRCRFCYSLRMKETAKKAKSLGLELFTTSLLSSPYQKHDMIKETAAEAARSEGVQFYYRDFRPFYYEGRNEARSLGFYMQKYCGCRFSKKEREAEKELKSRAVNPVRDTSTGLSGKSADKKNKLSITISNGVKK